MELLVGFQVTPDTWLKKIPGAAAVFVPSKEYAVQKVIRTIAAGHLDRSSVFGASGTHISAMQFDGHVASLIAHDVLGYNRYVYPPEVELGNRIFTFSKIFLHVPTIYIEFRLHQYFLKVAFSIARSHCFLEDTGSCCSFMATDRDQKKGRRPRRSGEPVHTSWVRYQKLKTLGTK